MTPLNSDLRNSLEGVIKKARLEAEKGARRTLEALAVGRRSAFDVMNGAQQSLRRRLRAHGRQLGDVRDPDGAQTIHRLTREVAYEHWHRMLFARFLAENNLLIEPKSGVAITLEECFELARERGEEPWAMAASFAEGMLPRIFREGDPALEVALPPETRQALEGLIAGLQPAVFREDDSLGWTYQFWQSAEKDAVNERVKSGEKITGETLPAVTQLFTEPYMVKFLLHNTIGAWHAAKTLSEGIRESANSEQALRDAVRLGPEGGYDFEYLRFVRELGAGQEREDAAAEGSWRPAVGAFQGWPRTARELKILDPCCGSGHFLVEVFGLVVRLRMAEEELDLQSAIRGVIEENLFGLELDPRCTQIAAFNLALAAWKMAGAPIDFPPIRIACSGLGPQATREEWVVLGEGVAVAEGVPGKRDLFGPEDSLMSAGVKNSLEALYALFEKAPELGSLIDPTGVSGDGPQVDAFRADFETLQPSLDAILRREDLRDEAVERAVAAKGMAEAARILVGPEEGYTLVITNVPFKKRGELNDWFNSWADNHYRTARNELATIFLERMLRWVGSGGKEGTVAAVTPQNWLFLTSYKKLREKLLKEQSWEMVARLGPRAFETISGEVVNVALLTLSGRRPPEAHVIAGIDANAAQTAADKAALLRGDTSPSGGKGWGGAGESGPNGETGEGSLDDDDGPPDGRVRLVPQADQLRNPDARVRLEHRKNLPLLSVHAFAHKGITTNDDPHFVRGIWEVGMTREWERFQTTVPDTTAVGGCHLTVLYEDGQGQMRALAAAQDRDRVMDKRGVHAWGKQGVAVSCIGSLPVASYHGAKFDTNVSMITSHDSSHLPAIWAFCSSPEFGKAVRRIDQKLNVTNATFVKVPFDLEHWQKVAQEKYPDGLPDPYSDDPTQWLFHGHPAHADPGTELHVAVARLLGYRWPAELDTEMQLAPEARALIEKCRELDAHGLSDADGIVPLIPLRGESSAADRLRALLAAAFGSEWSGAKERELLTGTAEAGHGNGRRCETLEEWLAGAFFEEHCKLFHHRPFLWHVWDGLRGGFGALVNYHRLAGFDGDGRRTLDALTFAYLGEWIDRQRNAQEAGGEGADARLAAALGLQEELKKILEGEPPYDLFVRWRPLHEQPLGWDPDINDGVRLNIRPFLGAEDMGRKGAGILRYKPNVKWTKDRGKEPESLRPRDEFPWFWGCDPNKNPEHRVDFGAGTAGSEAAGEEFDGARWNDLHYTRAAKESARSRARREREEGS